MADILANIRTAHRTAENAVIFCDNKFCDDHPETADKIAHAWQLLNDLVIKMKNVAGVWE